MKWDVQEILDGSICSDSRLPKRSQRAKLFRAKLLCIFSTVSVPVQLSVPYVTTYSASVVNPFLSDGVFLVYFWYIL